MTIDLALRDGLMRAIRDFFHQDGYIEVDTPLRIPAPAPEAFIDAEPSGGWFMLTSPELCMKRLLAAGHDRIFQLSHCFRRGERGRRHLPEFTLLEWYVTGADYRDMMRHTEAIIRHAAQALGMGGRIAYQGTRIDLDRPWRRMTVAEAFDAHARVSLDTALRQDRFDEIIAEDIEPALDPSVPVFLMDYPAAHGALARIRPDRPGTAERFELYIGGLELCNGFSELTDPVEQRRRFEAENRRRSARGQSPYPISGAFLSALADMPAATGNALGVDRLLMLFADTADIADVVPFTPETL